MHNLISAGGVVVKDGKILLVHPTGFSKNIFVFPKGVLSCYDVHSTLEYVDIMEKIQFADIKSSELAETAIREVCEETGYSCSIIKKIDKIFTFQTNIRLSNHKIMIDNYKDDNLSITKYIVLYVMRPIEKTRQPDWENDEWIWMTPENIIKKTSSRQTQLIMRSILADESIMTLIKNL